MATILISGMYTKAPENAICVDTTSKSGRWKGLSPFNLGPCDLYRLKFPKAIEGHRDGLDLTAKNFENLWQYAKVYAVHADAQGDPTIEYWKWAIKGWQAEQAHRYPMGRGAKPLYSLWDGQKLGYIDARKTIYAPFYIRAVRETQSFNDLFSLMSTNDTIVLRDYDGYDHNKLNMSLTDVLNNPSKKMGHAFVLKALLTQDPMLSELIFTE